MTYVKILVLYQLNIQRQLEVQLQAISIRSQNEFFYHVIFNQNNSIFQWNNRLLSGDMPNFSNYLVHPIIINCLQSTFVINHTISLYDTTQKRKKKDVTTSISMQLSSSKTVNTAALWCYQNIASFVWGVNHF